MGKTPPASDSNLRLRPFGLTNMTSISAGREWLIPVKVTLRLVSTPVKPVTFMVEGYGVAGVEMVERSLMAMAFVLAKLVAAVPVVVTFMLQPPAMLPDWVSRSSTTYRFQVPLGSAPLKTLAKDPLPSVCA